MTTVGVNEIKTNLDDILHRVQAGESIRIVQDGEEIAMLVPSVVKPKVSKEKLLEMIEQWLETRKGLTLGGLSVRELIDEGRM